MIQTNDYCSENERLNNREFLDLIPHLPLEDLLSIEYRTDIKWNRLIQLRDPSKKLYKCYVCSVVQCGVKNLFAHVEGKKHKLKMNSIKQLYQPKYTYTKIHIEALDNSKHNCPPMKSNIKYLEEPRIRNPSVNQNNKKSNSLHVSNNEKFTSPNINIDINDETVKRSVVNINVSTNKTERTLPKKHCGKMQQEITINSIETEESPNKSENNEGLSAVIVIDDNKQDDYEVERDMSKCKYEDLDNKISDGPPQKKKKMLPNPAAMSTTKMGKHIKSFSLPDSGKPEYQSNITIIPTKMKRNEGTCVEYRHCNKPLFTTKTFSCNPLDDDVHGLVGVEYIVKILKNPNDSQPKYECGLCEVLSDGLGMQNHLIGYNHRLKFCEKHFPTALRQYRQYIRNIKPNEVHKVMTPILNRLAIAIEQHHGRDLPYECHENEFNVNRHEVLSKVFSCRHASEQYGPTFTHIIDSKEVDELIAEVDKYKPPLKFSHSIAFDLHANVTPFQTQNNNRKRQSNADIFSGYDTQSFNSSLYRHSDEVVPRIQTLDNETHKLMVDDFLKNTCKQTDRSSRPCIELTSPQPPTCSISGICKLSSQRKSLSPLRENDVWQAYRHLVDQKVMDLNEVFHIYRSDPEVHPAYDQEWQMFWKRRKNELIQAGLDHRTYNYQPEWVRFFNVRIEELYNQAVENIKIDARERLYLPMTNENSLNEKYHVHAKISDKAKTYVNSAFEKSSKKGLKCESEDYTKKPHVVSVLRLLTALEHYLGSLGPKIVNLLSKALQAEKNNIGELNAVILTGENCSILETAMEKLKGLIISDIFDNTQQHALRKAITEVECLLSHTTKTMRKSHSMSNLNEVPDQNHNISKEKQLLAQVDKNELALKLASLLAAQGKTDIDPVQLQKIISVYILIEKKKQETLINSRGVPNDLLSQNNICNPPSANYSKFIKPNFSQRQLDSRLSIYGNTCVGKFQEHFGNMLSRNSYENYSNATFCASNSSNGNRNVLSSNYQQHMESGTIFGSQQTKSRHHDDQQQHSFDYKTHSQEHNKGHNNWSGNNWNWRKF